MRIVSLLSSATEAVAALGLTDRLVGISHECDYPPEVLDRPRVSRPRFDPAGLSSAEIDAAVRRTMETYGSVYEVDADRLAALRPDLVLTQAVCDVCAVPVGSAQEAVARLTPRPRVLSLDAHTLDDIARTLEDLAAAAGAPERGAAAAAAFRRRLREIEARVAGRPRPRALALEWLDPPFLPGHWVPEMIERAGGTCLLGAPGGRSHATTWDALAGLDLDVLLLLPCGYDLTAARADADAHAEALRRIAPRAVAEGRAFVGDGAYFSRSGPRVVEGVAALAHVFHPDVAPADWAAGRLEPWLGR